MAPTVSVALATFNGERFLAEQLDSMARQRVPPHELVVSDDGSTDGTIAIAEAFARRSPFPVDLEVNDQQLGFADNFLKAAARCCGDAVAFCDQDDVWLPDRIGRAAQALAMPGVALAVHANYVTRGGLRPTGATFPAIKRDHVAPPCSTDPWLHIPGMAMTFSRQLAQVPSQRRPPSHDLAGAAIRHDEWVYLLARVTGSIAFVAEPLGLYRQHGANVTGAPQRGALAFVRQIRATQSDYYAARRDQAAGSAAVLAELAATERDPALAAGAIEYEALARTLARRVPLYDRDQGRRTRLRQLSALAVDGGYRGAPGRLLKDLTAALT
jgi:glycosyltransferase involved in cell wall biosynthesis